MFLYNHLEKFLYITSYIFTMSPADNYRFTSPPTFKISYVGSYLSFIQCIKCFGKEVMKLWNIYICYLLGQHQPK